MNVEYSSGLELEGSVDSRYLYLDGKIKKSLKRSAGELVLLGCYLRLMKEEGVWSLHFRSFDSYLKLELHMDPTLASRFIAANKKYSVNGTVRIDEKYKDYSQGLLIEMLNMPPELEAKITPDMTVREVRDLKRQARKESKTEGPIRAITELSKLLNAKKKDGASTVEPEQAIQEGKVATSQLPDPDDTDDVPDVEYQELDPVEKVATSQLSDPVVSNVPMSTKKQQNIVKEWSTLDESARMKWVLEKYQENLTLNLSARMLPDFVIYQKKLVVTALEYYIRSLECSAVDPDSEPELQEKEPDHVQPDLPALKNNDQRKAWLRSYKEWGLWYRDDHIGVEYYKYDFDNGARLIVEVFQEENVFDENFEVEYYHLVGGPAAPKVNGMVRWTVRRAFSRIPNSETELVEFLKHLQKKK